MPPHSSSSHHPLKIVPKELVFPAPLNRVITNILKLQNVTQSPIAYKVKTTAPQRYCVRPNNGILPPGETIEVQVLLNYVKDAPPNLDIKDKFQIQSIILPSMPTNAADITEVWAKATNEQITKQKLKSRFAAPTATKPPSVTSGAPNVSAQDTTQENVPPQTTSTSTTTSTHTNTPNIPPPQNDFTPKQTLNSSQQSLNSSQQSLNSSQQSLNSSQHLGQTPISSSQNIEPVSHSLEQTEKKSLADSNDMYSTPVISSITPASTDRRTSLPQLEPQHSVTHDTPKPTGDYVVDTVANFSKLRQTLEQVAQLKSEKEGVLKDNQRLNDQVKMLVDQLQRSKEETVGLRQRTTHNTPGGPALVSTKPDSHSQQMLIQIQTKVLLIVVLFFAVIGFLLGRYSH